MKTCIVFPLFFLNVCILFAQNLVPDPSFEGTGACVFGNIRAPWQRPMGSITTPDLFNSCAFPSTNGCFSKGLPVNMGGPTNPAHSGNAYAGIVDVYDLGAPNGREYIQVQLMSPLVAGQRYNIGFWILRPDSTKYATDGKGLYLSRTATPQSGNQFINVIPQVISGVITDANDWTLVSSVYTALGGEEWLTIGNFYDDAGTTIQPTGTAATNGCILIREAAYYFIDDVFVEANTLLPIQQFNVQKTNRETSLLSWELANINAYEAVRIQRSRDGIYFETLKEFEELKSVQMWEDENPLRRDNYYRLEMVLKTEMIEYTSTKVLHYANNNLVVKRIYPNPFDHMLQIYLSDNTLAEELKITLLNAMGQSTTIEAVNRHHNGAIEVLLDASLSKGVYVLVLETPEGIFYEKVVKK